MFLFYQWMRSDNTIVGKTLRLMQFTFNVNKENGRLLLLAGVLKSQISNRRTANDA